MPVSRRGRYTVRLRRPMMPNRRWAAALGAPDEKSERISSARDPQHPDASFKWAQENAPIATAAGPSLEEVKSVLAVTPKVLDPKKDVGAEEADAYVLALAVELKILEF